ncbi:hypothetical protein [Microvirga subterranea]|uniref:hypothetical protein n=1 Tax=Microvirga subterranea TaxID=186651 RepID=UPI0011C04E01|nr:hypothetical protein [Microvirga subterranea]
MSIQRLSQTEARTVARQILLISSTDAALSPCASRFEPENCSWNKFRSGGSPIVPQSARLEALQGHPALNMTGLKRKSGRELPLSHSMIGCGSAHIVV